MVLTGEAPNGYRKKNRDIMIKKYGYICTAEEVSS